MTAPTPIATPEPLMALLDQARITHATYAHAAVFTVDESADIKSSLPGGHTKNLFLKDKKGSLWLVTALHDTDIDLKWLRKRLSVQNLSFANAELMQEHLGVTPGSVTPLGLMHDKNRAVNFVLDARILACDLVNCHPLRNDMTTALKPQDLIKFLEDMGYKPVIVDF